MEKPEITPAKSQEEIKRDQVREELYRKARVKLGMIFGFHENGEDRARQLKEDFAKYAEFLENGEALMASLETCARIENKKEFVETVLEMTKPFVELALERPELFAPAEGQSREFIKINDLLSYGIGHQGDLIHIHVVPDAEVRAGISKLKEGFQELAKIVKENERIETIRATSWIVAKHPKILEKLGFILDGEISKEMREKYFPGEKMAIHGAHMDRKDFLEKYFEK